MSPATSSRCSVNALAGHTPARVPGLPPFTAGAVGFLAYDVVRQIERLPDNTTDDLGLPDACLMFFDEVLAFDHVKKEILLVVTADLRRLKPQAAYADALKRLDRLEKRLAQPLPKLSTKKAQGKLRAASRTKKAAFLKAVERAKEYIAAGDIFQVVLSQRLDFEPGVDPFSVYRALRIVNPSPYMYFFRFGRRKPGSTSGKSARGPKEETTHIVGSSPELLVRVEGRRVEYRPIAGTRPRGASESLDLEAEREMLTDEKERAEHVMLVDLGRNDVGRVSEYGTVKVTNFMFVERYSHVMHLVSSIEGQAAPRTQRRRRAALLLPCRNAQRRTQNSRHGNHRRIGTHQARHLRRNRPLRRLFRQSHLLHRHPHAAGRGQAGIHPGRRRHRRRLSPRKGIRRKPEQSESRSASGGKSQRRLIPHPARSASACTASPYFACSNCSPSPPTLQEFAPRSAIQNVPSAYVT